MDASRLSVKDQRGEEVGSYPLSFFGKKTESFSVMDGWVIQQIKESWFDEKWQEVVLKK